MFTKWLPERVENSPFFFLELESFRKGYSEIVLQTVQESTYQNNHT